MPRAFTLLAFFTWCVPAMATDVTLLVGYQFNSDFEVTSLNDQPPVVSPGTGEPGDDVGLDDAAAFSLAVDWVFNNDLTKRIGLFITHEQTQFDSNAASISSSSSSLSSFLLLLPLFLLLRFFPSPTSFFL